MSAPLLIAEAVTRRFGTLTALEAVSLQVAPGERVALLGHNGAGKTTLFRLILGFIAVDAGRLTVAGEPPGSKPARRAVAYLPENVAFPATLTGRELLTFYARLKGVPRDGALPLLDTVGLADASRRRVGTYSKGMRQRLGLAQALIGRPRLLLLDEPTSGLDPLSRRDFYGLLDCAASDGTAILLSSHSLAEVAARTDRVAILRNGRLVADAPLARLKAESGLPIRIRLRTRPEVAGSVAERLGGARLNGQAVELTCSVGDKMGRLAAIAALGPDITDFEVDEPGLDDVYAQISAREGPA